MADRDENDDEYMEDDDEEENESEASPVDDLFDEVCAVLRAGGFRPKFDAASEERWAEFLEALETTVVAFFTVPLAH